MNFNKKVSKKINNYLYDHIILKGILHEIYGGFFAILSAAIFAFGFICFTSPANESALAEAGMPVFTLVTGGVSGISQNIALILRTCGVNVSPATVQAVGLLALNLPLVVFAFFKIGKRFSILTLLNIGVSSLFIRLFSEWNVCNILAASPLIINSVLTRALFAGICTGVSSAIAFKADISCGGSDIVTYYFALRKSTSVGKYNVLFNGIIVTVYSVILVATGNGDLATALLSIFFSIIYLLVCSLLVDTINVRNKKIQIQLISSMETLPEVLMANFPHGITVGKGKGAYSGNDKYILWMIVSSSEVKKVVQLARRADPHVFISVTPLSQVYGNFFIKPVE